MAQFLATDSASNATAIIQLCKRLYFAKRGTQSDDPFSILCSCFFFFFLTQPLLWLTKIQAHKKQSLRLPASTLHDPVSSHNLMFQHLFLPCTKTNKRNCWQTSKNQQESMQYLGVRYYPDGSLISGNKQNPESRKHPQPLSHWEFTNTTSDSTHIVQKPFPYLSRLKYTW